MRCRLLRIARARPFLSRTTKTDEKNHRQCPPRAVPPGRAMTRFSPAGWARRERRGPRSRGKRPLLRFSERREGAREGVAFFLLKGCERRARKKKQSKSLGPAFPLASPTLFQLKQSSLCSPQLLFLPDATMYALAQRASLRVGAPVSVSSAASGCERSARRLDGDAGKRDFILFF